MVGRDILEGMNLSQRIEPTDYSHLIVACLLHDIGYMRGVLSGDTESEFVVDDSERQLRFLAAHQMRPSRLTTSIGRSCLPMSVSAIHLTSMHHVSQALFGRRPPQLVDSIVMPASENLHTSRLMHRNHDQLYSITSSARPSNDWGTVRPSILAVLRLMTISTFVACWTGRSAGFSPLRIRPV
jgi:hypothetical protein